MSNESTSVTSIADILGKKTIMVIRYIDNVYNTNDTTSSNNSILKSFKIQERAYNT